MFPNRYFTPRYFGDRYFPPASTALIPELTPVAAIVSIPNWGVPYNQRIGGTWIRYKPPHWEPPRGPWPRKR